MRVTAYDAVRRAAKNWGTFSSDLQGDTDVRDYRQLPLEVDPPAHRQYRDLLEPFFGRVSVGAMEPAIRRVADEVVAAFISRGGGDAVHALAFPLTLRSLAVAFRREADLAEWERWGIETWITRPDGTRDGRHLDRYLARVMAEAREAPDAHGDIFARLAAARIENRALTDDEFRGLAGLVLAGGRDTVIKLVAGAVWHLARTPQDFAALQAAPERLSPAIEEWLRWLSPLPRMAREVRQPADLAPAPVGARVQLDFLAANHDPTVFVDPARVDLARAPNHHVAFGNGPHTCIGAHLARTQARAALAALLSRASTLRLDGACDIVTERVGDAEVPTVMRQIPVRVTAAYSA